MRIPVAVTAFLLVFAAFVSIPAASADTTGATSATVTITGGFLSLTVPVDAGSLGTRINSVGGGTISGPLGQVQVSDARSAAAGSGWVASVTSTAFTPPAGPAIPASAVGYTVGPITKVGTATYTANDPPNLTGVAPVVTATGITGDNSATWNPTINVAVPGGMAVAVYSATITHSVI
ncbi:MAG: Nucleoporin 62kDa-like protein [Actinomycetia bacterium]|nr:Nucleoporin 62kDa-like protein [Actinomycetes bacterium]